MKSISQFFKDRWAATGWSFIFASVGSALAVFAFYMAAAIATGNAHAQTSYGNVATQTTLQGNDTTISSTYTTRVTGGLGGVEVGSAGKNTKILGNSTEVNTSYTSLNSAQTFINGEKTVFNEQGTITTVNKNGVETAGSVTAAKIYTQGLDVGNELINQRDAIVRNDAASIARDNVVKDSVTATNGRIDVTNDALIAEMRQARAAEAALEAKKADKTQVTTDIATAKGEAITTANTYTDNRVTSQSTSDRAYTDKAVGEERSRALAAEAELRKETKQVGAMAMAAAGVAGATPVGDKKSAVSIAAGTYSGQSAIAVGITHLINERTKIFGAVSGVTSSGGSAGATVGASFSF